MQVWDTGAGIPGLQQALVFQEYYQLGNPERDRAKASASALRSSGASPICSAAR
jgi:hypothetical protein